MTTVQGLPKKFDQKKILKVIKKKFGKFVRAVTRWASHLTMSRVAACNGTIVNDSEMGEVIQLQGDQRKDVQEFLVDKTDGLDLESKTIKVCSSPSASFYTYSNFDAGPRFLDPFRPRHAMPLFRCSLPGRSDGSSWTMHYDWMQLLAPWFLLLRKRVGLRGWRC